MILVSNLKKAEGSPLNENFLSLLPETCDVCGMGMSIQPTLTTLSCINPRCEDKIVVRMVNALEALGIKGIGEESAKSYVREKKIINPLNILWENGKDNLCDGISFLNWTKVYNQIEQRNEKGYYLYEIVQLLSIPGVQTSAEELFKTGNLDTVYSNLEEHGVAWVQNTLGINAEGGVSVRAVKIYEGLMEFKEDLYDAVSRLTLRTKTQGVPELTIVCSTAVGHPYKTKKHFAEELEKEFEGVVNFKFSGSVTKNTDYLVWSGADGSPAPLTSKVKTVLRWNENEEVVRLVTGSQLVEILRKQFG